MTLSEVNTFYPLFYVILNDTNLLGIYPLLGPYCPFISVVVCYPIVDIFCNLLLCMTTVESFNLVGANFRGLWVFCLSVGI